MEKRWVVNTFVNFFQLSSCWAHGGIIFLVPFGALEGVKWPVLANKSWKAVKCVTCRLKHLIVKARPTNALLPSGLEASYIGDGDVHQPASLSDSKKS